jgi:hypothetical protein
VAQFSTFDTLRNSLRTRNKNLWLCFPLAVTGLGDGILTLVGNNITGLGWGWETSPTWRWFLHHGALPFGFAFVGYLVVVGTIVAYAPLRLAKVLCVTMVLAHTDGIMSWLHLVGVSYFLEPLVYAAIAIITVVAFEQDAAAKRRPALQSDGSEDIAIAVHTVKD